MALAITVKGANFTKFVDRELPYASSTVGYFLMGATIGGTLKNRSPRATGDATVVGNPDLSAAYAELDLNNYIDTGITIDTVDGDYTMISVASIADNVRQPLCGTWHSGIQDAMLDRNPSLRFTTRGSGSGVSGIADSTYNSLMFHAGVKQGANAAVYLKTSAGLQIETGTAGGNTPALNAYRIGPSGGLETQTAAQVQNHAANLLFDVALTEQQIIEVYDYLAFRIAKRGSIII
ncbi:hypothetical protein [Vreelandella venusta]|uniref:hypothetical protein n=1 Tax=Vreelandella venusta TaxID=44935 RepID=UPI003F661161